MLLFVFFFWNWIFMINFEIFFGIDMLVLFLKMMYVFVYVFVCNFICDMKKFNVFWLFEW